MLQEKYRTSIDFAILEKKKAVEEWKKKNPFSNYVNNKILKYETVSNDKLRMDVRFAIFKMATSKC